MKRYTIRKSEMLQSVGPYCVWDNEERKIILDGLEMRIAKGLAKHSNEFNERKVDENVGDIGDEITDEARRGEIAKQVKDGYTSGHLDDGEGCRTYWRLVMNTWRD